MPFTWWWGSEIFNWQLATSHLMWSPKFHPSFPPISTSSQVHQKTLKNKVIFNFPDFFPDLNLSHNRMSSLPEEISQCTQLESVDVSYNTFISLPNCLFNLPKIIQINAKKNFIAECEVDLIRTCGSLESLNLEENPLTRDCQSKLELITTINIQLTPKEVEEWEDLAIWKKSRRWPGWPGTAHAKSADPFLIRIPKINY